MKILVVGAGGREHAITWSLARSPRKPELYIAPGNPGTATLGRNVGIASTDVEGLLSFARTEKMDLTIVGPEQPLVLGLVDRFEAEGLAIVGPSQMAARLEGSKAFAKAFMERYSIPTARHQTFSASMYDEAARYLRQEGAPVVIKASGLAAGKGAVVCETLEEAEDTLRDMLVDRTLGDAASEVVIEAFMEGEEVSIFALTDGRSYVLLPPAQDHKRIGEGDTGPNTGGMGAYAPAPLADGRLLTRVCREVVEPTLAGMEAEGHPYKGILYCGLMVTKEGPKVVEFNCRLGDPEAQAVLPLVESDMVTAFEKVAHGRLDQLFLRTKPGAAACVVMASEGYPGAYCTGSVITGLDRADQVDGAVVFHAGTSSDGNGNVQTAGGRVLGVTAVGDDLKDALERAYRAVDSITFEGKQYRRDIGWRGIRHFSPPVTS
jgi:phosphoribosylamine---glycine ligase